MAVIAVDFDHTLVDGEVPLPGAKEAINLLRERGHKILIHSCNNISWIKRVLDRNDIRYDGIYGETGLEGKKPLADCYVDDKSYRFMGDWKSEVHDIINQVDGMDNRKW